MSPNSGDENHPDAILHRILKSALEGEMTLVEAQQKMHNARPDLSADDISEFTSLFIAETAKDLLPGIGSNLFPSKK